MITKLIIAALLFSFAALIVWAATHFGEQDFIYEDENYCADMDAR